MVDVRCAVTCIQERAGLVEARDPRTVERGRPVKVILGRIAGLTLHSAVAAVTSRHYVHQHVLDTETAVTLADEAGHAEVSRPDAVEAELVELAELRATDDVDPVRIRRVLQQPGDRPRLVEVDVQAE